MPSMSRLLLGVSRSDVYTEAEIAPITSSPKDFRSASSRLGALPSTGSVRPYSFTCCMNFTESDPAKPWTTASTPRICVRDVGREVRRSEGGPELLHDLSTGIFEHTLEPARGLVTEGKASGDCDQPAESKFL